MHKPECIITHIHDKIRNNMLKIKSPKQCLGVLKVVIVLREKGFYLHLENHFYIVAFGIDGIGVCLWRHLLEEQCFKPS